MTPSENCLALIRVAEGLRLKAYLCPAGVWTIGYGHTGGKHDPVLPGQVTDTRGAELLLKEDAADASRALDGLPLTQNQFDALVSLAFNIGSSAFAKSTMRRLIVDGLYGQAAAQFPRWAYANGRKLPGLVVRRDAERALFQRPA